MAAPAFTVLLAADPAPSGGDSGGGGGGLIGSLPIFAIIFFIFYFLVIRPQSRERKKRELVLKGVKKHDKVVTTAGIHGTVVSVSDTEVILKVDDEVRLKCERSAIWQVKSREEEGGAKAEVDAALEEEARSAETTKPREKGKA